MKEGVETLVDDFLAVLDNRKPSLGEALTALGNCPASAPMRQIGRLRKGGFLAHRSH